MVSHTSFRRQPGPNPCGESFSALAPAPRSDRRRTSLAVLVALASTLPWPASASRPKTPQDRAEFDGREAAKVLQDAVHDHAFPGCAVSVGTRDGVLWRAAFGRFDYTGGAAVSPDTLYDLASLTKVVGTTSVVLTLVRDGLLSLDQPVQRTIPELDGPGCERITVAHLLTHSSGLPAWKPLYRSASGYDGVLAALWKTPLETAPGARYRYSDLGFMVLGELAARVGKKPLAQLERERVFGPLGMRETLRNPPEELWPRIAPTERPPDEAARAARPGAVAAVLRGVVHDENARAAGGGSGHAGVFSTAEDLSRFGRELLRGLAGDSTIFPAELLERFVRRSAALSGSSRALGWDTPTPGGSAGGLLSRRSFGHTGFTGTSLWIDPERGLYLVLLTNRVHPTRANNKIRAVRRALADAVAASFDTMAKDG